MAYIVMAWMARGSEPAYIVMPYIVVTYIVMTYIVMAYIVMPHIVMAYIVMAYKVMAYIVMAYIGSHSSGVLNLPAHLRILVLNTYGLCSAGLYG